MAYTEINFKSAKELKLALKSGREIRCFNPGMGGDLSRHTGSVHLEGPHYPAAHKWYLTGELCNGKLVAVR